MEEIGNTETQLKIGSRDKSRNIFERLSLKRHEAEAKKQLVAMAEAVKYQLALVEEVGFSLISTKEGFWKKINDFDGVQITRITEISDQPEAKWDARRFKYRLRERDIEDGQIAILFLPYEFICNDDETAEKIQDRVEKQQGNKDYENMLAAVLGEAKDLYKPEQWEPSAMRAIVSMRKGDFLYSTSVNLDDDPYPVSRSVFERGRATMGHLIYLTRDEESEYGRFNEKFGKLLITRRVSRAEIT